MNKLSFSILTPALPSRWASIQELCATLQTQIESQPVEHLILVDNKRRTVGEKRDALLRAARGDYIAFVDDDDTVSPDYVSSILERIAVNPPPDVVTFRQVATVNGEVGEVEFRLDNPNEEFKPGQLTLRNAWHVCAFRRSLAICSGFPATNYGEDIAYASALWSVPNLKEEHIPKVLHFYYHSSESTEAPPPT